MADTSISLKRCSSKENCIHPEQVNGGWLPATPDNFFRSNREKSGLGSVCKYCSKARYRISKNAGMNRRYHEDAEYRAKQNTGSRKRRQENPEVYRERNREYYYRDIEASRARSRAYEGNHRQEARDRANRWRLAHPDYYQENIERCRKNARESNRRHQVRRKQYREDHADERRKYNQVYEREHADNIKLRRKQYRLDHPEKGRVYKVRRRAREKGLPDAFNEIDWQRALDYFHGVCAYCSNTVGLFDRTLTLHRDHFVPLTSPDCQGTIPENIVPACQSCNLSKNNKDADVWLEEQFGKRKAKLILKHIREYFDGLA